MQRLSPKTAQAKEVLQRYLDFIKQVKDGTEDSIYVCNNQSELRAWERLMLLHGFMPVQLTAREVSRQLNPSSASEDNQLVWCYVRNPSVVYPRS